MKLIIQALVLSAALSSAAASPAVDGRILEPVFDRAFSAGGWTYTGAVVAVVQDGRVVLLKGYGYRDAAHTRPVDPDRTRFRVGSISKTFVAAGLGRLMDRGLIRSVDDPINRYLRRVEVPDNDGRPITIRMLGTHETGFYEGRREGWPAAGETPPNPDGAYLRSKMPGFLRPAETGSNYSNFGIGLLGYACADLAGRSYAEFVRCEVFEPLHLGTAVVVTQPGDLPEMAEAQAFYPDGTTAPIPQGLCPPPSIQPAGAVALSGADMARYMISLLGGNADGSIPPLVSDRTAALLMTRQGGTHPLVQGYGVVFMINSWNGHDLVEHGGRLVGTFSYMTLVPNEKLGIFVSLTGEPGQTNPLLSFFGVSPRARSGPPAARPVQVPALNRLRAAFLEALFGRYIPPLPRAPLAGVDLSEYAGDYGGGRRLERPVTALFTELFMAGSLAVRPDGAGGLRIGKNAGYRAIARDVFWRDPANDPAHPSGWDDLFVFRRNTKGRVVDGAFLYTDNVYDRLPAWRSPRTMALAAAGGALVLLSGLFSVFWRKRTRGRALAPLAALGLLGLPALFFGFWPKPGVESAAYLMIRPAHLVPFQLGCDAVSLLAFGLIVAALRLGRPAASAGFRAILGRWHLRLLALASVPLLWAFWHLNMIGWNIY